MRDDEGTEADPSERLESVTRMPVGLDPAVFGVLPPPLRAAVQGDDQAALIAAVMSVQATIGWLPPPAMLRE